MKRILALSFCILTLFLCACQPTPEVEPVPNKGDDVMGEKIHTTPVPKTPNPNVTADPDQSGDPDFTEAPFVIPHIDVPEHWTEEMTLPGGTQVFIDADIEYEDVAHPVYLIRDAEHFDGPTLKKLIDFFGRDMQWRPVDSTRQELIDKLEYYMTDHYYTDPDTGEEVLIPPIDDLDEVIADLTKKLQELDPDVPWENIETPEDIPKGEFVLSDGQREYHTFQQGTSFAITGYNTNDYILWDETMILQNLDEYHKELKLPVPSITNEEAIDRANAVVRELGLSDHLKLAGVTVSGRTKMDGKRELYAYGWRVTYGLNAEGGGVLDWSSYNPQGQFVVGTLKGNTPSPNEASYKPDMKMEQFSIYIEDGELMDARWTNPQELIYVENPAVELMPFDEIKERIKDRIEYGLSWGGSKSIPVRIDNIMLLYLKSAKANSINEYYYTPVWGFTDRGDSPYLIPLKDGINFINAIDGTFVQVNVSIR